MLRLRILSGAVIIWIPLFVSGQRRTFNWTSIPAVDPDSWITIPECGNFSLTLKPTEDGIFEPLPPFYLISLALAGPVNIDRLHGDEVDGGTLVLDAMRFSRGTNLLMYAVDSVGNSGGGSAFGVENGTTSNCHPSVPFSPINATLDKNQVSTCDTLHVFVTGGRKPYTITSLGMQSASGAIQNYTMGADDDTLELVNRALPGVGLMLFASDADGQRSFASSLVASIGSTDISCNGRQSRSFQNNSSGAPTHPESELNTGAIIGGVIGGVAALIILSVVAICVRKRRQRRARMKHSGASLDLGKDESVTLSTNEALPYIVTQWYGPRDSGEANSSRHHANEKRTNPSPPADVPLLGNARMDQSPPVREAPAQEAPALSDANALPKLLVSTSVPTTTTTTRSMIIQTNSQTTNAARRDDEMNEPRRIVRHVDAEEAVELPPGYRD